MLVNDNVVADIYNICDVDIYSLLFLMPQGHPCVYDQLITG